MNKQLKDSKMEKNDSQIWDELLESKAGVDVFAELMKQAKQEVADGKSEEN